MACVQFCAPCVLEREREGGREGGRGREREREGGGERERRNNYICDVKILHVCLPNYRGDDRTEMKDLQ